MSEKSQSAVDEQANIDTTEQTESVELRQPVVWEASEYVHHDKDIAWFGLFGLASALVMLGMYLLLRDILSIVVVGLMAIALVMFANRPPRVLRYTVGDDGLQIGDTFYNYESFKSFSISNNGPLKSVILNPLARIRPPLTIYFSPEDGEKIIEIISHYLPLSEYRPDMIDRFAERIRF